jgi:Sulfatase
MWRALRSRSIRVLQASVPPFLLLVTPFVAYVQYQRHGLTHPEVMLFILLLAIAALLLGAGSAMSPVFSVATLAALITLFADIQAREPGMKRLALLFLALCVLLWLLRRHAHRIVSLMVATVLALSFLPQRSEAVASAGTVVTQVRSPAAADLPLVLHLLLDEFIGVEGVPTDLAPDGFKQDLQSFFVTRGFRLFGKAYSEYPITKWSVPQLLNLAPGRYISDLAIPGPTEGTYRLTRNAYFERFARMGYAIKVHEPDFLYLCPDGLAASCRTHPVTSLPILEHLNLPLRAKLSVVATTFLERSDAYIRARDQYQGLRRRLHGTVRLPPWNWERGTPPSAGSMPMFEAIAEDLSKAQRGTFVFAHVLVPHYPYVYDAQCGQRPTTKWLGRSDAERADVPGGIINVPKGRAARYAAYFEQVACTEHKLDQLLDAIPPRLRHDAVVIVQGDHGSRITLVDPTTVARATQTVADYADAFSTLFAVRSASIDPGYDLRMSPITCLLRTLAESDFRSTDGIDACSSPHTVFFMARGKPPAPRPLPDFAEGHTAHVTPAPGS